MYADLHMHTIYSDGTLSPQEIVEKAKKHGIGLISVSDHNTVAAYPQLMELCPRSGIRLLSGTEIDCYMGGRYVHLLGYGFDLDNRQLLALLQDCKTKLERRNDAVIGHMAKDYAIDLDEFSAYQSPRGGYKNCNYLLDKGIIHTIPEYFALHRKYNEDTAKYQFPQLRDVCSVVRAAGGYPVLAHPWNRLDRKNFEGELHQAADAGVMGLECYYPTHSPEIVKTCVEFCKERNLFITAGGDEHGEFNTNEDMMVYGIGRVLADTDQLSLGELI